KEDFAEMVEFQHARGTRAYLTFWEVAKRPRDGSRWASYVFSVVGTSRCDVPARVRAGGTNRAGRGVAPALRSSYGARTAQCAVPTITPNRYWASARGRNNVGKRECASRSDA